ncbi:MAG: hypothetical protein F7C33_03095 [Desulfurococcales archaeon]|nr:hypothetical protein [Desulfurococcales archaeon]
MGSRRNIGVGIVFALTGIALGIATPYALAFMNDQEFIHLLKILFIIGLVLLGGLLTATGIIIMLPTSEEE